MSTPTPGTVTVPAGTQIVRMGYSVAGAAWQGGFATGQTISHTAGTPNSIIGTVDVPCVFSVAAGHSLPDGVTLTTLSPTQVRIDMGANLLVGEFSFRLEATAL